MTSALRHVAMTTKYTVNIWEDGIEKDFRDGFRLFSAVSIDGQRALIIESNYKRTRFAVPLGVPYFLSLLGSAGGGGGNDAPTANIIRML